jgi:hypothetical protein
MKWKTSWLVLPLLLFILVLGVKWRVDHPTPTKTDLEIRALMLSAATVEVFHTPRNNKQRKAHKVKFSTKELKPLTEGFYISPQPVKTSSVRMGVSGTIQVYCFLAKPRADGVAGVFVTIAVDDREGRVILGHPDYIHELNLHPVTVKRWLDILLADPRLYPRLQTRKTL